MLQDQQQIIWLASYQKSGNTWTRALLANYFSPKGKKLTINELNQFTTGDVRMDYWNKAAGGEFNGTTLDDTIKLRPTVQRIIARSKPGHHFVKTHTKIDTVGGYPLIEPAVTAAAIYIMRNPFDVLPSFARHMGSTIDQAIDIMADPKAIFTAPNHVMEIVGRWDDHIDSWLNAPGLPRHYMRYEDMTADTAKEMRKLLAFLRVPVKEGQLKRAIRAASFKELQRQERQQGFQERPDLMEAFFHTGKSGGWRDKLSPEQVARVRHEFKDALEKYYPEMLAETAEFAASA